MVGMVGLVAAMQWTLGSSCFLADPAPMHLAFLTIPLFVFSSIRGKKKGVDRLSLRLLYLSYSLASSEKSRVYGGTTAHVYHSFMLRG